MNACPLCSPDNETVLWQDDRLRVIQVPDAAYPGFCRVILNRHVREMTDLDAGERAHLMAAVFAVEAALRALLDPGKINLASLGNQVPHLHWHVIPRFTDDSHFPDPVWAPARRAGRARPVDAAALRRAIAERLGKELE
ncbi:MAG TPA: HIT family protein [Acidiferrobacterales bacterium]|jgi:diadenosine tetraphosphate (Ap4A) HIT family hydrolase